MKQRLKKILRFIILRFPGLRRFIARLNGLATDYGESNSDFAVGLSERNMYTPKAMFTGYSVDYLNSILLSKEERSIELKRIFYRNCNYYLDLDNPKTFNQKLQWLKLNYFDHDMERCVDKCEFKRYIAEKIGEGYTVPMYGEWESENDIDFDSLPDKFILKSNVQSDGRHIIVVEDKNNLNIDKLKTVMCSWLLRKNNLCSSYCGAYKQVKPKILAEEFISGLDNGSLIDYKFMCFNGKAEMLFVVLDRGEKMSLNFYDLDWNLLPFTRKYPNSTYKVDPPKNFKKMIEIANKLAEPFPFVRVDFYESADGKKIYVGELTFYPGGGYECFEPLEWDYKLGDMITLPEANM